MIKIVKEKYYSNYIKNFCFLNSLNFQRDGMYIITFPHFTEETPTAG